MEASGRVEAGGDICRPVICACNALAEVVCLECGCRLAVIVSAEFQVDLIKCVRIEYGRGDHAGPWGGLQDDVDFAVLEIARRPYIGRIAAFLHGEDGSVRAACGEGLIACNDPVLVQGAGELCEVGGDGGCEAGDGGACS